MKDFQSTNQQLGYRFFLVMRAEFKKTQVSSDFPWLSCKSKIPLAYALCTEGFVAFEFIE